MFLWKEKKEYVNILNKQEIETLWHLSIDVRKFSAT